LKESHQHKLQILLAKRQEAKMKSDAADSSLRKLKRRTEETMALSMQEMKLITLNGAHRPADVEDEDAAEVIRILRASGHE
jgi:hypothetical protein